MIINRSIKIKDGSIVLSLQKAGVTAIRFRRKDGYYYAIRTEGNTLGNNLLPYKKIYLQIRTPQPMRDMVGCEYKITKSMMSANEDELFRMMVEQKNIKIHPPELRLASLIITESYINANLDERCDSANVCLGLTTDIMMENGVIEVYIKEGNEPMSCAFRKAKGNLVANIPKAFRDRILELGKDIRNFVYVETNRKDEYYKYGIMTFKEEV